MVLPFSITVNDILFVVTEPHPGKVQMHKQSINLTPDLHRNPVKTVGEVLTHYRNKKHCFHSNAGQKSTWNVSEITSCFPLNASRCESSCKNNRTEIASELYSMAPQHLYHHPAGALLTNGPNRGGTTCAISGVHHFIHRFFLKKNMFVWIFVFQTSKPGEHITIVSRSWGVSTNCWHRVDQEVDVRRLWGCYRHSIRRSGILNIQINTKRVSVASENQSSSDVWDYWWKGCLHMCMNQW